MLLIDEVMTPDSSRFWPADGFSRAARSPASTNNLCATGSTSSVTPTAGTAMHPRPSCPPHVVEATSERYRELYRRLTGAELAVS